ncbi:hypothetical protein POM88_025302 [Heracleum sosnowskyi]|uniref:RING-type domain-containing protein n=1 Tax=Heracleum sosnowskyi TaxID=360622 RepID=A0AAD8MNQ1_9APIA|nr:hypothetical protein POM88_025302 [Heracleum sosnowskyi]
MSANNKVSVASCRKRKCTHHPHTKELVHVFQTPCVDHKVSCGQNSQSFTCPLESDHYNPEDSHSFLLNNAHAPGEANVPLESFLRYQYQQLRETCQQHFENKYNNLLRHAEVGAATEFSNKDKELAHMQALLTDLKEKVASVGTKVDHLHEVIKNKDTEIASTKRKNVELEQKLVNYKSDARIWKEKIKKAELLMCNCTNSQRRHSACQFEEEDTASSIVERNLMEGAASCKVCGKGTAAVTMWPCRHLCICKKCDLPQKSTRCCPVCNLLSVRLEV